VGSLTMRINSEFLTCDSAVDSIRRRAGGMLGGAASISVIVDESWPSDTFHSDGDLAQGVERIFEVLAPNAYSIRANGVKLRRSRLRTNRLLRDAAAYHAFVRCYEKANEGHRFAGSADSVFVHQPAFDAFRALTLRLHKQYPLESIERFIAFLPSTDRAIQGNRPADGEPTLSKEDVERYAKIQEDEEKSRKAATPPIAGLPSSVNLSPTPAWVSTSETTGQTFVATEPVGVFFRIGAGRMDHSALHAVGLHMMKYAVRTSRRLDETTSERIPYKSSLHREEDGVYTRDPSPPPRRPPAPRVSGRKRPASALS